MAAAPDTNPRRDAALGYAAQGIEVMPCDWRPLPDGDPKAPLTPHGFYDATTDPAQINAWWEQYPNALIGARVPEGIIILDLDPRHDGDAVMRLLEETYGAADTGLVHQSGRGDGGEHRWYQMPTVPPGNKLSIKGLEELARKHGVGRPVGPNRWACGIDLLHHSYRYTILPPSPHPDTGRPYVWVRQGRADDLIPWLAHHLTHQPPPKEQPRKLRVVSDPDSIADWFSANHSWHDVLGPEGWILVSGDGDSDGSKWRYPNASAKHSATIKHECLFVYTPNTPFEPTGDSDPHGYTRFAAWALLEHDGDQSEAAGAARELKGDGWTAHDPTDLPPDDQTDLDDPYVGTSPLGGPQPWPDPRPLYAPPELPSFPLDVFPPWIRDHIRQIASDLQVPVDLPAILALGALSVAVLGKATVRYRRQRWTQPLNLYVAVACPPSTGKSPAKSAIFAPLDEWEREQLAEAKGRELELRVMKKKQEALEANAARSDDPNAMREAMDMAFHIANFEEKPSGRLMADDITSERLGEVLAAAGGQLAIVSAEGGIFDKLAGLYSSNGKASLDVYLEGWGGGRLVVDRVSRSSIYVTNANVAVVVTVQLTVLDEIGTRKDFVGRGLTARFLLAMPFSNVGWRNRQLVVVGDDRAEQVYRERLIGCARRAMANPIALFIDDEGESLYADWDQALEDGLRPGHRLEGMAEWVGKLRANMLRVAALLHLAEGAEGTIGADRVRAAIELGDYFLAHARHIEDRWSEGGELAHAQAVLRWLRGRGRDEFSVKDVFLGLRRRFPKVELAEPALDLLTERGWIKPMFVGELRLGRGRGPSPRFRVHPQVRAERVERAERAGDEFAQDVGMPGVPVPRGSQTYSSRINNKEVFHSFLREDAPDRDPGHTDNPREPPESVPERDVERELRELLGDNPRPDVL